MKKISINATNSNSHTLQEALEQSVAGNNVINEEKTLSLNQRHFHSKLSIVFIDPDLGIVLVGISSYEDD